MTNNSKDTSKLKESLASLTPRERLLLQDKLKNLKSKNANIEKKETSSEPIAIIGMAFHFPGGTEDIAGYWEILSSMRQVVGPVPAERRSKLTWQGGYLKDIDKFDAAFFNISPREAELMDPQQRLLMQAVWHTIEDAGYDPLGLAGSKTGLYVGLSTHDYRELILATGIEEAYSAIGTSPALISNRISYWFDFRGPSETLDTACSSSLVALHQAVLALRMGHCKQALVGATNLLLSPNLFIAFEEAGMLSSDGRCKVFDKDANGYVRGEGIAALLLKPLNKAEAERDRIYGVILGSAVNHGGRANSLTAPNPVAQKELLIEAYQGVGISPETVSYIEAHGTGTPLGDPIEVEGLQGAFQYLMTKNTEKLTIPYCGLGSVKANLGHLEAAAGIAGVIKVLLMFQHKQLSGQVYFQSLNPYINLENSPFYIVSDTKQWESEGSRRAGVSSFGFGGANAHVILEEGPEYFLSNEQHKPYYLLTLSAKHPDSLKQRIEDLISHLQQNPLLPIEAVAYTLNVRRSHFKHRLVMLVSSSNEFQEKLEQLHLNQKIKGCFKGQVTQEPEDSGIYKQVLKSSLEKLKELDVQETTEYRDLLEALASLYVKGYELDWGLLHQGENQQAIALPTYPFLKERYWLAEKLHRNNLVSIEGQGFHTRLTEEKEPIGVYYYEPSWQASDVKLVENLPSLLIINNDDLVAELEGRVKLTSVKFSEKYLKKEGHYAVNKTSLADFRALFNDLKAVQFPGCIVYRNQVDPECLCQDLLCFSQALIEQKDPIEVLFVNEGEDRALLTSAISAVGKVLQLEHPHIQCRVIEIEKLSGDVLQKELGQSEREVRYRNGQRQFKVYQEVDESNLLSFSFSFKPKGTYLITGGAGGLGLIFAEYLVKHHQARLVLTGRSELSESKKARISELGPEVSYIQADITNKAEVKQLLEAVRVNVGPLTGILHCAGMLSNALIVKKDPQSLRQVLAPKILGTQYLDELTQEDPLEHFVLFSSVASVFTDVGQYDYAYANGFMDGFASHRENLRKLELRKGKTLSINWPMWVGGGMQETLAKQLQGTGQDLSFIAQLMEKNLGVLPLEQKEGLKAFLAVLNSVNPQVVILPGRKKKLEESLERVTWLSSKAKVTSLKPAVLVPEVVFTLKQMVGKLLKIAPEKLKEDQNLSEYGMDSINFGALAVRLNDYYQLNLTPAIFYAQPNIQNLSTYLATEFNERLSVRHSGSTTPVQVETLQTARKPARKIIAPSTEVENSGYSPVAIIGMHGIFPQSDSLESFWQHLSARKDLITEIPANRWDWRKYYDSHKVPGKSNSKWGGFIDGVDRFDAAFFNISPREAELMDPQHRLFLETVWKAFEEGGYNPYALPTQAVGVFVGVQFNEYQERLFSHSEAYAATGNAHSMLPNRVSYLLNLQGPSEAIDTACSSSLIAIHRAVSALHNHECRLAVAGGVSLALSPHTYIMTSQMGVLSSDGRCKTFDKSANGYVKGEGVGAILLKPLAQAKLEGDKIHGIIIGSAVNHGGKAQSLTAPNPNAQSELLKTAYRVANIHPSTISYIETHGTGTVLGDPIEIDGLKKAFEEVESKKTCAIGCVKTNIGHLEPAAGIAGVIKVLLSMQHTKLPGNLNFKELNPHIDLNNTPFYILEKTQDWQPLVDEKANIIPRRAGISSFGFGGANAHMVIEESPEYLLITEQHKPYYLICLSAKHPDSLNRRIEDLSVYLSGNLPLPIEAIAYTLNTRRNHFNHRLAMVVSSTEDLKQKLEHLQSNSADRNGFRGEVTDSQYEATLREPVLETLLAELKPLDTARYKDLLETLASQYVRGYNVDWTVLHQGEAQQRISLPTYPFLKTRHWIDNPSSERAEQSLGSSTVLEAPSTVPSLSLPLDLNDSVELNLFALQYLQQIFSEILKVPVEQLLPDKTYEIFGVDSLSGMALIKRLEADFGPLSQTLIFEKNCLTLLSKHFLQEYPDKLRILLSRFVNKDSLKLNEPEIQLSCPTEKVTTAVCSDRILSHSSDDGIAIIGLHGNYPLSETVSEFWDNLKNARDCITDLPINRWDPKDYPVTTKQGIKYYDQGGFISDVDKFDPLFFNISPFEASLMDPQERLFLQTAWKTIEDAGYTRRRLTERVNNEVGVFVGVTYHFYPLYIAEAWSKGDRLPLDIQFFPIANRVSYFFNFSGPSFPIDTACSSSLAAIHLACESIKQGDCKMALAGGVNLSLHPAKYHMLGSMGMLSESGRCMSFAANGTGYVPGEGVGAVLLKPLKQAIEDRDPIYGIIRSSSINHGGKTSGFTVPNPNAQSELILNTLLKADIDARTVNYLEAHGTGTSLGDPIEVKGLQLAFGKYTQDKQFCSIGSVKSNIGHAEAAAGISQLTKVLLQFKHKMLVPSLHTEILNPYINFSETAFYVERRLEEWRPVSGLPRRAGISSFGAGGTNVHIIVEEHVPSSFAFPTPTNDHVLFVFNLSAHDEKALHQYIKTFYTFLISESLLLEEQLENICYTLQIGREMMPSRFSVVVKNYQELLEKLENYLKNPEPFLKEGWQNNSVQPKPVKASALAAQMGGIDYELLAKQWVNGEVVDWDTIYPSRFPQILSMLPTYPFMKRRCWVANQTAFLDKQAGNSVDWQPLPVATAAKTDKQGDLKEKKCWVQPPEAVKEWLYAQTWRPTEGTATNNNSLNAQEQDYWLIFGDKILTPILAEKLSQERCVLCLPGEAFDQVSSGVFTVNPSLPQDYQKMFSYITEQMNIKITQVIYLWFCDQVYFEEKGELDLVEMGKTEEKSSILLSILKSLVQQLALHHSLAFSIITCGGQVVIDTDKIHLWQHHLWALTGIFAAEYPQYLVRHIDLDAQADLKTQFEWLYSILFRRTKETYFSYRNNQEYVLRLTNNREQLDIGQETILKIPRVALITGGLGALGLEVANWLVERGTQRLLLIGNTILPDRSEWENVSKKELKSRINGLMALEAKGAYVHYTAVDVSDQEKMKKLVSTCETEWQETIESVFHLAGITTDGITIERMSNELLKKVLAPKIQGTLVLHEIFKQRRLKHFVLFSSVSAIPYFGLNGLTAYATANAFLEGFAHYRRSLKLPVLCVSWTAWQDKGMSLEYKHIALLDAIGLQALPVTQGIQILEYLLSLNYVNSIVQKVVDWRKFFSVNPNLRQKPYFEDFYQQQEVTEGTVVNFSQSAIYDVVTKTFAELMQLLPDEIDHKKILQDYGLDSILGVNFVVKLGKIFPDIVSVMDLYRYNNLEKLINYITQKQQPPKISQELVDRIGKNRHQALLDEIIQLNEEEVYLSLKKEIETTEIDS